MTVSHTCAQRNVKHHVFKIVERVTSISTPTLCFSTTKQYCGYSMGILNSLKTVVGKTNKNNTMCRHMKRHKNTVVAVVPDVGERRGVPRAIINNKLFVIVCNKTYTKCYF